MGTVLSHLIFGSFIQPLAAGVANLPVSMDSAKYLGYVQCATSAQGGRGVLQIS